MTQPQAPRQQAPRRSALEQGRLAILATTAAVLAKFGSMRGLAAYAETIPGWVKGEAAREVARRSFALGDDPTIVEVGVFMGRSTALLAGPRREKGSGKVHCVDAFDCSGDAFSIPHYERALAATGADSLEGVFRHNIHEMGLAPFVEVHKGPARDTVSRWSAPIDLLLLDSDHSPAGARESYEAWEPYLKKGGLIILHNTGAWEYAEGHDGNRRIAVGEIVAPKYADISLIDHSTFARKVA